MKTIKFRAWDKQEEEMIAWEWFSKSDRLKLGSMDDLLLPELEPMQFIGLTDINGVEIYEGDIVKTKFGVIDVITFLNGAFCILDPSTGNHAPFVLNNLELEVIGNIFENKELLKEEKHL